MTLSEKLDQLQGDILEMQEVMRAQTCNLGSLSRLIALAYTGVGRTLSDIGRTLDHLDRSSSIPVDAYADIFQTLQKLAQETEKTNRYLEEVAEPYFQDLARKQFAVRSEVRNGLWQLKDAVEGLTAERREAFSAALIDLLGWKTAENQTALQDLIQAPEPDLGDAEMPKQDGESA